MANLIKIRGLQRGAATNYDATTASGVIGTPGEAGPASVRGFRVKSPIGRQYNQALSASTASVAATLVSGSGGGITWTANYAGVYGNNIQVAVAAGSAGLNPVVVTTVSGTANPVITVNKANTQSSAYNVSQAAAAVNSDPLASQWVTATYTSAEAGIAVATFSAANLSGGLNGSPNDAEPGPQTGGVSGEPIFILVTNYITTVVDTDDQVTARTLMRNRWRFVEVGPA